MRDGTVLRADVYRPKTADAVPVILMRTQYGKDGAQAGTPLPAAGLVRLALLSRRRARHPGPGRIRRHVQRVHPRPDRRLRLRRVGRGSAGLDRQGRHVRVVLRGRDAVAGRGHRATAPRTIVPANTASDYYDGWTYEGGEFRLAFVLPWAMESIATTAAENRGDKATVHELAAAAADPTRWMDYRPFKDLPPMQPANPAVAPWYFDWIRHSTRDDFWKQFSIRDRYPTVDRAGARLRGLVRRLPRRRRGELRGHGRPWRNAAGPREPAPGDRPVGPRRLGTSGLRAGPAAQVDRPGGQQPDQRPDARLVRPFSEGQEQRRGGHATGGLFPDGRQYLEDGVVVATAADDVRPRTTCPGPATRRPQGPLVDVRPR